MAATMTIGLVVLARIDCDETTIRRCLWRLAVCRTLCLTMPLYVCCVWRARAATIHEGDIGRARRARGRRRSIRIRTAIEYGLLAPLESVVELSRASSNYPLSVKHHIRVCV
jgi:hypothetical protein